MSLTPALSLPTAGDAFERTTIERRELRPDDVRIDIHYAGICHTDLHFGHNDHGRARFPLVPGHEIAGTVAEIGPEVEGFEVGDRVGVGCIFNSCEECEHCAEGLEQYCDRGMVMTYSYVDYDGTITQGGYSRSIVIGSRYVLRIPDALGLDAAAPLLCAGITMYSPLRHWGAGPGTRVAIVGMGGLGHLGVKLAKAMGAEVTVLSRTTAKEEDARRFGAADVRATSDPATFTELAGSFDLILNTVSATVDVNAYIGLLALDGTLVSIGLPTGTSEVDPRALFSRRRSVSGSMMGGIPETQEMLDFCAEHGIRPEIETIAAEPEQVRDAWRRVEDGSARYRVVIDTGPLAGA